MGLALFGDWGYTLNMKNLTSYQATDRQGRTVIIKQLSDNRLVLISQDGYMERREIIALTNGGNNGH